MLFVKSSFSLFFELLDNLATHITWSSEEDPAELCQPSHLWIFQTQRGHERIWQSKQLEANVVVTNTTAKTSTGTSSHNTLGSVTSIGSHRYYYASLTVQLNISHLFTQSKSYTAQFLKMQLNMLFIYSLFKYQTVVFDPLIGPYLVLPLRDRWDQVERAMKGYSILPKAPGWEPHNPIFCSLSSILAGEGFLILCRDAVGVFYSNSRLDSLTSCNQTLGLFEWIHQSFEMCRCKMFSMCRRKFQSFHNGKKELIFKLFSYFNKQCINFSVMYGLLPNIGIMVRVFANGPEDLVSIPGRVIPTQRLKKWFLRLPCLTLSIVRKGSRVKWINPGKGLAPSPTRWSCSYRKVSLQVMLDYGNQLYFT